MVKIFGKSKKVLRFLVAILQKKNEDTRYIADNWLDILVKIPNREFRRDQNLERRKKGPKGREYRNYKGNRKIQKILRKSGTRSRYGK